MVHPPDPKMQESLSAEGLLAYTATGSIPPSRALTQPDPWLSGRSERLIEYKGARFLGCQNWVYFVIDKAQEQKKGGIILPEDESKLVCRCVGTGPGRFMYGQWCPVVVCKAGDVIGLHLDPKRAIMFELMISGQRIRFIEDTQVSHVFPPDYMADAPRIESVEKPKLVTL